MPILNRAPSPAQFANAWATRFDAAVRPEGGRDGRISRAGGERVATHGGGDEVFAADVVKALDDRGQKTISVDKLVRELRDEVEEAARLIAGPNQRVSLTEAQNLPTHLVRDFMLLRGKLTDLQPVPLDGQALRDAVSAMTTKAFDDGANKLSQVPWQVRGVRPVVDNLPHAASNTRASVYVADGRVFASRAASFPTPLVGWYDVGAVPTR